jgi:uncharacterized protein YqgV (UPF0045/DUF77 family)
MEQLMNITVDISMYPLNADYKPAIKDFIRKLRRHEGLTLVTNQMSTQINGDFAAVTAAVNASIQASMQEQGKVVFIARYLNADLDIATLPEID